VWFWSQDSEQAFDSHSRFAKPKYLTGGGLQNNQTKACIKANVVVKKQQQLDGHHGVGLIVIKDSTKR
jgi:hypothetical protein